jgi:polyisoprenoid-binding protein YceI
MSGSIRRLPLWLLALGAISLPAYARDWQVDAAHSTLTFRGTYQNGPFEGRFARFEAAIRYDEADLAQAKFDVTVDVGSVDTQSSERDDTLRTADFFDTARFPQARFVTSEFTRTADGGVEAKGSLTIRDRTRPVTLKVKFAVSGGATTLDVDTVLNRLDFGLGAGSDWADIGRDVRVHGHLVLLPK